MWQKLLKATSYLVTSILQITLEVFYDPPLWKCSKYLGFILTHSVAAGAACGVSPGKTAHNNMTGDSKSNIRPMNMPSCEENPRMISAYLQWASCYHIL